MTLGRALRFALGIGGWLLFLVHATDSTDGYRFERKQWTRQVVNLDVHLMADIGALVAEAKRLGVAHADKLDAFSTVSDESNACVIYILDPESNGWQPEIIGHEVAHCIWGDFHPSR